MFSNFKNKIVKMDFLQGKVILGKGLHEASADALLKKKTLILYYFTTGNCSACRSFDPKLKEVYKEAIDRRIEIAIIVICFDTDKDAFIETLKSNYQELYAIKFEDDLSQILVYSYGVTHTPSLVVVRKNGSIVTKKGTEEIEKIGINVLVTWAE